MVQRLEHHYTGGGEATAYDDALQVVETVLEIVSGRESAAVATGLISRLRNLPKGKSLILTLNSPDKIQFEVKRLQEPIREVVPMICVLWCPNPHPPPILRCCATLSIPIPIP
jgi:hypothetical protein